MERKTLTAPKIRTDIGEFDAEVWSGSNESWIEPEGDYVLVLPDQAAKVAGTIILPEDVHERITEAAETGVIVAIGPEAWIWNSDRQRRRESAPPTVGTRVFFARYTGQVQHGRDGKIYRLMEDKAIGALERAPSMPVRKAA